MKKGPNYSRSVKNWGKLEPVVGLAVEMVVESGEEGGNSPLLVSKTAASPTSDRIVDSNSGSFLGVSIL